MWKNADHKPWVQKANAATSDGAESKKNQETENSCGTHLMTFN